MKTKTEAYGDGKWRYVFLPKDEDEEEILDRFIESLKRRSDPNACKACSGSALSSKGQACFPCRGTGIIEPKGKPPLRADGGPKLPEETRALTKVISGGQTGADVAGLDAALAVGLKTGGMMPAGFMTLSGGRPEYRKKYGVEAHSSPAYPPRTFANAANSDATMRLAFDFTTRGEILTLTAAEKAGKPHFDVDLSSPPPVKEAVDFLRKHNVSVLNVAGNAEQHHAGTYKAAKAYLIRVFKSYGIAKIMPVEGVTSATGTFTGKYVPPKRSTAKKTSRR